MALMGKWAKCAPALYAEVNAEAMQPLYEEQERKKAEAKAAAEAEERERQKRLEDRARQQHENLVKTIDQRMAHHGVPTRLKKR